MVKVRPFLGTLLLVFALVTPAAAQNIQDDRARGVRMLNDIKTELKLWYYDPTFNGRDLNAHIAAAVDRVKQANSQAEISAVIASALLDLNDSHTFFLPPPTPVTAKYGFVLRMVGDRCLVGAVDPAAPAFQDGLRAGTEVLAVQNARPTRETLWKIDYSLHALRPRREVQLTVRSSSGAPQTLSAHAVLTPPRTHQNFETWVEELFARLRVNSGTSVRTATVGTDVLVAKLATFSLPKEETDKLFRQTRGKAGFVLDLRENGGGALEGLTRIAGYFFADRTPVGELRRRRKVEPLQTERRASDQVFTGKLVVLVDSASGSASEVLARLVQLTKRGIVVGDRTAGAVMAASRHYYKDGHEGQFVLYGLTISEAALLMADHASLEHVGVTPDETLLPASDDLEAGRDPVLARAIALLGGTTDATAAGKLFPRQW